MTLGLRKQAKPPVGVIESLTTGFEIVASRIGLIAFPIALDMFLWLGPHLSINPIMQLFITRVNSMPRPDAASIQGQANLIDLLTLAGQRVNVFALLSTAPLGVPSLMAGKLPVALPGGQPLRLFINDPWTFLLLAITFSLAGLFLGSAYFSTIAMLLRDAKPTILDALRRIVVNWARLAAFSVMIGVIGALASVPFLLAAGVMQFINPWLGAIGLSLWSAAALWALLYVAFGVHGIVMHGRGVFGAIWDSIRLVQWNLMPVIGLFVIIVLLNWGLGYVWNLPAPDSWLTLAGIAGHAFVSTGLVAATFVFYKDRYRWWSEERQHWLAVMEARKKR